MVAYFFMLAFRKVVFPSKMLCKMTFSECQNAGAAKLPYFCCYIANNKGENNFHIKYV